jgi:hypothetical protein
VQEENSFWRIREGFPEDQTFGKNQTFGKDSLSLGISRETKKYCPLWLCGEREDG